MWLCRGALSPLQQAALCDCIADRAPALRSHATLDATRRYWQLLMWRWPDRYGAMVADNACDTEPDVVVRAGVEAWSRLQATAAGTAVARVTDVECGDGGKEGGKWGAGQ